MESGANSNSHHARLEALEGSSAHLNRTLESQNRTLENLSNTLAGMNAHLERLERRIGEKEREREHKRSNDEEPWSHASRRGHGRDERRSDAESLRANRMEELDHRRPRRRGGRIEARGIEIERWIEEEGPSHSEEGSEPEGDPFHDQRPIGRRNFMEGRRRNEDYDEDYARGPRHQDRGLRKPKIDFPKFGGGDPYEWMDKAEQYFDVYEVPRRDRVTLASFHLEGRASRWWRWIRDLYEKDGKRLGWTAFVKEFMSQWGPSPIVNHHGQLAKLKQEGRVQAYIDEFRLLQTMVSGWSEEALLGTFLDGLKPWLAKELKLKQPARLQEAMRMAEILDQSYGMEKKMSKESFNNKASTSLPPKGPWKGKEEVKKYKERPQHVKKLSRDELQDYIKKGLCFKCGDKWSRGHQCKTGQAFLLDVGSEEEEATSEASEEEDEEEQDHGADFSPREEEAELSLHAMSGVQRPSTMRLMAWVGKHEVSLLVDSGSSHNFINSGIVKKVGLKGATVEPFEVKVASGEKLKCQEVVRDVRMNIQGVRVKADLHVLQLVGLDVVLGNAWLKGLGKVLTDYSTMTMEFKLGGQKKKWTAMSNKEVRSCEANMIEKLCKGGASCYAIVVTGQHQEEDKKEDELEGIPPKIRSLLEAHHDVMKVPTSLPPPRSFDHPIRLKNEATPVNVPPYRYAHFQKEEIERQVEEMLKQGLIRHSTSPFSSPVLLVKKKDGTWRFCTDYRALNEATIKDRFPIPTVDEMLDELHGATVFTKLDLRAGYHQIRMKEEDIHKTAFRTHSGHYEYLVMPFGLCNAPSTFQATMNEVFRPYLRKFMLVFFDDILVYSHSMEEHVKHLEVVLSILEKHHFYIKPSKCAFAQKELEYLGHIISGEGVKVDQRKIEAMVDWPLPKNISALRGFLGLTGYYRRFVKNYGLIARPLTSMLKKGEFEWTPESREAFDNLKRAMTQTPVLALPDFSIPFEVYTDASGDGIGAVLVQQKRPLAFLSKALGPMKKAWGTYARELLALVHAVKVWRPYLLGKKFTIITDQQALRHLLEQKIVTPDQQKFLVKLLGFEYDIVYQPGKENKVADALSRKEGSPMLWAAEGEEPTSMALSGIEWRIWDQIREANKLDARALEIKEKIEASTEGVANYKLKEGLIIYKGYVYVPNVPNLRRNILDHFHNSKEGGHSGWFRTYIRVKHFFYWEGLKAEVKALVAGCEICQKIKYDPRAPMGLLQPLPIPSMIWEDISMDFVEGLPTSKGYEVIIVVVDRLSKYAHFIPIKHPYTAKSVATSFVESVIKLHGVPKSIVSDRDRVFMSTFWKELFTLQGSILKTSSSYHPQTDGQTEVTNRTLEQYLRCFCHNQQSKWGEFIVWAEYWYNTTFHASIKTSPFELVYGRPPPGLHRHERGTAKNEEVEQTLAGRDEALTNARRELKKAQERMKRYYDKNRREVTFNPGDFVYLKLQPYTQKSLKKNFSHKLSQRFYGPFKVVERMGEVAYRLDLPTTSLLHPVFHVSLLKKAVGDPSLIEKDLPTYDHDGRLLLQPKEAIKYRIWRKGRERRKEWQVLISWEGMPKEGATWENYEEITRRYPHFILEDKDILQGRENVEDPRKRHRRGLQPRGNTGPEEDHERTCQGMSLLFCLESIGRSPFTLGQALAKPLHAWPSLGQALLHSAKLTHDRAQPRPRPCPRSSAPKTCPSMPQPTAGRAQAMAGRAQATATLRPRLGTPRTQAARPAARPRAQARACTPRRALVVFRP
ncbi:uncharacterized protein LOC120109538 [Phoenix dactylifera]|uniref:Uncharacterized protein LOC120109538 n=1 Tax=Phoenix dactylifera TaxID=42345 RepID=A0A8B9A7P0_PHODC|nr:uncharacterized protein LOC120109538 [Phoenix dactylifera]